MPLSLPPLSVRPVDRAAAFLTPGSGGRGFNTQSAIASSAGVPTFATISNSPPTAGRRVVKSLLLTSRETTVTHSAVSVDLLLADGVTSVPVLGPLPLGPQQTVELSLAMILEIGDRLRLTDATANSTVSVTVGYDDLPDSGVVPVLRGFAGVLTSTLNSPGSGTNVSPQTKSRVITEMVLCNPEAVQQKVEVRVSTVTAAFLTLPPGSTSLLQVPLAMFSSNSITAAAFGTAGLRLGVVTSGYFTQGA